MNLTEAIFLLESNLGHEPAKRQQVRERAVEIAGINNRRAEETTKADWEQAKRELASQSPPAARGNRDPVRRDSDA